jgi:RNA polymerase sigma-70 factor, ECF subfamily
MGLDVGHLSDDMLVERFKTTRDNEYFGEIFRRHKRAVFGVCSAVLGNRAEAAELSQDTFMRAMVHIDGFRGGAMSAWLCTIARHLCLNRVKTGFRLHERELAEKPGSVSDADPESDLVVGRKVRGVLAQLSVHQRTVLKLFYINGYTYREIASLTGLSEQEVKTHMQNGRRRFRLEWAALGTQGVGTRGPEPRRT